MAEPIGTQTLRYAAGLPLAQARKLDDDDRRWLRGRLRRLAIGTALVGLALALSMSAAAVFAGYLPQLGRLGGAIGLWLGAAGLVGTVGALVRGGWLRVPASLGVLYLLGLAAVGALVPELTERPHPFTKGVVLGIVVLGVGVLAVTAARYLRVLVSLRRVSAEIAHGHVDRFEGVIGGSLAPELRPLAAGGQVDGEEGDPCHLDVLPRSGLIVRANGRRCEPWIYAHIAEVAPALPHALRVQLPAGVAPTAAAQRFNLQRRSLTAAEQAELDKHIARLRRRPWGAVLATAGLAIALSWQLGRAAPDGETWSVARRLIDPIMLGWYALAIATVAAYVRRLVASRKLDDDRRLRWVVTVEDDGADVHHPPRLEVLPVSQLAWTENASPALWRTSRL